MISHSKKFIFVHVPKCAGTSMERFLFKYAGKSEGCKWAKRTRNWRNKKLFGNLEKYNDYYSFCFTRNPFDRFISAWKMFCPKMNLVDFLYKTECLLNSCPESVYEKIAKNNTESTKIRKLLNYKFKDHGNIGYHLLPQTYFKLDKLSFVGTFENIKEEFWNICDQLEIKRGNLRHVYKQKRKSPLYYISKNAEKTILRLYEKDFNYLDYSIKV